MEHPLNGQHVLRCQLLHHKPRWSVYSYFISFINLFSFACKHICSPSSSRANRVFARNAVARVFPEQNQKGGEQRTGERGNQLKMFR